MEGGARQFVNPPINFERKCRTSSGSRFDAFSCFIREETEYFWFFNWLIGENRQNEDVACVLGHLLYFENVLESRKQSAD